MTQIDDKIKAIINHFNLNNYAFSKRIGVTGTTIDSSVNGRLQPDGSRQKTKPGYDDPEYIETLQAFQVPQLRNGTFKCFEIQGNSMMPTFFDGDMVFGRCVENFNDIKDGQVYVIISKNDGVVLKRVINCIEDSGKLLLNSDNKDGDYPTYTINTEDVMEVWNATMLASKQRPKPLNMNNRLQGLENKIENLQQLLSKNSKN